MEKLTQSKVSRHVESSVAGHSTLTKQIPDLSRTSPTGNTFGTSRGNFSRDSQFLPSLEAFRALAILCVVAGHVIGSTGWVIDTLMERIAANLLLGGTNLFVFISGYLFHHIFHNGYSFKAFFVQKSQRVLLPYLFLSTLPILMAMRKSGSLVVPHNAQDVVSTMVSYASHLLKGDVWICYWYIPFVMGMFALAPMHRWFGRQSVRVQLPILVLLFALATLIERPVNNIGVVQLWVYFTPVYLAGIAASVHRTAVMTFLSKYHWLFLVGALTLSVVQAKFSPTLGSYHKNWNTLGSIDLQLIQKMLWCGWFLYALQWFDRRPNKVIELLAASSFAVFFIHPYVLDLWMRTAVVHAWLRGVPEVILAILCVHAGSIIVATGIRKVARKRSRILIGW